MMQPRTAMTTMAMAGLAAALSAGSVLPLETVDINLPVATTPGQSVFFTSTLPVMGSNSVTKSVKLSPHDYVAGSPSWKIRLALPAGLSLSPTVYKRNDAVSQLASAANGAVDPTPLTITTAPLTLPPIPVSIYTDNTITSVSGLIDSADINFGPQALNLTQTNVGGQRIFTGSIPMVHAAYGRRVRFTLSNGAQLPADSPVRLTGWPIVWRHGQAWLNDPPAVAPTITTVQTFTFVPSNFQARTIRVQLPRDYTRNPNRRYPVLYAQDGQNCFSPGGPFGSWDLDIAVRNLTARGEIPEMILVGVDNSNDRIAEYIPNWGSYAGTSGRGTEFLEMVRDELMPEIKRRYRVADGPTHTGHIGSSLGGLLGYNAANDFSTTFGAVACLSSSFWINPTEALTQADRPPNTRARLYLDSGTAGTSNDDYNNTMAVRDRLIKSGHVFGPDFWHVVGLNEQHNEAAWRNRSPDVLRWMFPPEAAILTTSDTLTVR